MDESTEIQTDGNSLLKAVYLSRLRLTRLLLEGGAYVNESNEHGETPLMVACMTRHSDTQSVPKHKMVQYLLENGADPNIQDKSGKTALMHACLGQDGTEVLSLLLSSGADPTLEDHSGLSALVYAVNSGNREILKILMDACKAKGKEVIIITINKQPSGHQTTKQYLNVPPPPDLEEHLYCTPTCSSPFDIQRRVPPQSSSASASPKPGIPPLGLRNTKFPGLWVSFDTSQPDSPIKHPSPINVPNVDKRLNLQRLHSWQWVKSPHLLHQKSQTSLLTEEQVESPPEFVSPFRGVNFHCRPPAVSRHHSVDMKDAPLKALDMQNDNRGESGRGFARKMSFDSAASAQHSSSHPNLHQENNLPFPYESSPAGGDTSDSLRQLNISSLQNVIHRRNIGVDHYSSDSQLPQFGSKDKRLKCLTKGSDRPKLTNSRSSTLSGSRDSLDSSIQRRATVGLERRGSGPLLQDHISSTRPGYLPPLNRHAPVPDIGVNAITLCPLTASSKTFNIVFKGSKPVLPCAPILPRDMITSKTLSRRHSMQSEQIKQLSNFEEKLDH
ncbi:ankyrin repeat domain 34Bb [Phyllopteryx taeniolatus]|uniref:ankyrin repeat domain 34Bb n=1 Tax=Phyllopteryx taeniolatus TaxID=161469 RepID=UPI002AD32917|nr:ankyrin repeat domain 34Bb [Phyllopteryx taeniolatus]XP_061624288.1 ankyrin repeat domain 34Bb [Phyllopteryx taeniolatus]